MWTLSNFEEHEIHELWKKRNNKQTKRRGKDKANMPLVISEAHSSRLAFRYVEFPSCMFVMKLKVHDSDLADEDEDEMEEVDMEGDTSRDEQRDEAEEDGVGVEGDEGESARPVDFLMENDLDLGTGQDDMPSPTQLRGMAGDGEDPGAESESVTLDETRKSQPDPVNWTHLGPAHIEPTTLTRPRPISDTPSSPLTQRTQAAGQSSQDAIRGTRTPVTVGPVMEDNGDQSSRGTRKRKAITHLADCLCGSRVSSEELECGIGVVRCKKAGCETEWVSHCWDCILH